MVFVGWDNLPCRLGIVYCSNRRSLSFTIIQLNDVFCIIVQLSFVFC